MKGNLVASQNISWLGQQEIMMGVKGPKVLGNTKNTEEQTLSEGVRAEGECIFRRRFLRSEALVSANILEHSLPAILLGWGKWNKHKTLRTLVFFWSYTNWLRVGFLFWQKVKNSHVHILTFNLFLWPCFS